MRVVRACLGRVLGTAAAAAAAARRRNPCPFSRRRSCLMPAVHEQLLAPTRGVPPCVPLSRRGSPRRMRCQAGRGRRIEFAAYTEPPGRAHDRCGPLRAIWCCLRRSTVMRGVLGAPSKCRGRRRRCRPREPSALATACRPQPPLTGMMQPIPLWVVFVFSVVRVVPAHGAAS